MSLGKRIKTLRKALDLTQESFCSRIGLKRNSISLVESDKRNISDQAILSICREFNVNEEWLRNGTGEMFKAAPSDVLDQLAYKYHLSEADYVMVEKFVQMRPEIRRGIFDYIREVSAAFADIDMNSHSPAYGKEPPQPMDELLAVAEPTRNTILTDKMEFHILEFKKLPQELKENSDDLLLWAKFISSEQKEEFEMLATKNKYIESAYEQLQVISQDKQKRLEYEAREKAIRDHNQMMFESEQRGEARGIEKGKKEGIEIGETQKSIAIAKNLIAFGMTFDNISQMTGLSVDEIEKIRTES